MQPFAGVRTARTRRRVVEMIRLLAGLACIALPLAVHASCIFSPRGCPIHEVWKGHLTPDAPSSATVTAVFTRRLHYDLTGRIRCRGTVCPSRRGTVDLTDGYVDFYFRDRSKTTWSCPQTPPWTIAHHRWSLIVVCNAYPLAGPSSLVGPMIFSKR